jgi:hypothetical protein
MHGPVWPARRLSASRFRFFAVLASVDVTIYSSAIPNARCLPKCEMRLGWEECLWRC